LHNATTPAHLQHYSQLVVFLRLSLLIVFLCCIKQRLADLADMPQLAGIKQENFFSKMARIMKSKWQKQQAWMFYKK
jgi:hypothetical protein